ncbi:hypothetical protein JNW88_17665 [Micromonospora sp. ATA32]|nr:hypothetical protein [Micromonospora sp. ATA32]
MGRRSPVPASHAVPGSPSTAAYAATAGSPARYDEALADTAAPVSVSSPPGRATAVIAGQ